MVLFMLACFKTDVPPQFPYLEKVSKEALSLGSLACLMTVLTI